MSDENSLVQNVIEARKAAEAAMPLGHGVQQGSEARAALILIAQIHAITGGGDVDFSEAPEYVEPEGSEEDGEQAGDDTPEVDAPSDAE